MPSRVTDGMMYGKGQESVSLARERMIKNQEQAVTGKSVNRPSDNPVNAMRVVGLKAQGDRDEQITMNLEIASATLAMTDASLGELTDLISRTKELAIQMSSSSNFSEDARLATAHEVEQLMYRAIQIGNSRAGERYLFGGYQTERAPFDMEGNYFGDSGVFELELDRAQKLIVNVPGISPFFGKDSLSAEEQKVREQPGMEARPTIDGGLRAPASVAKGAEKTPEGVAESPDAAKAGANVISNAANGTKSGTNIFLSFKKFNEGLRGGDIKLVQNAIDDFDDSFKQILSVRALVGARQNLVAASQESLERNKVSNAEQLSAVQDADTFKVIGDIAKNEHALNATLEVNKRLITPSLLDFLK